MPWSRKFDDPLPHGMVALKDAADYIRKLPKPDQESPHWQTAIEALILAAEDRGPAMHARIGMLRALNFGKPRPEVVRTKTAKTFRIIR